MNRKILIMILFSLAAHMAVAAVIVYLPSNLYTNKPSGDQEKVIWGYVSDSAEVNGIKRSGMLADNIFPTDASIKYKQKDQDSDKYIEPVINDNNDIPSQMDSRTDGLIQESYHRSDDTSDYAPLPGSSFHPGDSICNSTPMCGDNVTQTVTVNNGSLDKSKIMEYVRKEIERHKYYPHIAKLRGIEGTVYVNFFIGQDGVPGSIAISRSSGSKILDQAGILTVMKIGKITNMTKELRELDIVVPITYKLE